MISLIRYVCLIFIGFISADPKISWKESIAIVLVTVVGQVFAIAEHREKVLKIRPW